MKHGAVDFLEKPITIEELQATIKNVLSRRTGRGDSPGGPGKPLPSEGGIVGSKEWIEPFLQSLRRIAQNDATVLLLGETGTGKSAVAREIWKASARSKGPFININCPAIP